jgi:alkylation response protein AidB-like acyl-CoA dehydrogenase
MHAYQAPLKDMQFALTQLAGFEQLRDFSAFSELDQDTMKAVLGEAARFAGEVLSPLNESGDREGTSLKNQQVQEAQGFAQAYQQFVEGGWAALPCNPEYGGSGLPLLVAGCVAEMWSAANSSFALCPMLGQGAISALEKHASSDLQQQFLHKLVSGEWTGTMNLTEPQAGSDLAAVRCKAEPKGDHYLLTGTKIFITWGDHSMTDNIVHLVLARTPDAPEGVKGISLFVVPKFLLNENGEPNKRNDAYPVSVEHKMGIHASPTCVMSYGDNEGAVGYLVGQENQGLVYMFTMMNHARLNVGLQGVALGEGAYQQARAYALERVQGVAAGRDERGAIIQHPDVRRMLLLMKAQTEASRAVCYVTAAAFDKASQGDKDADVLGELLTPIAKAWSTELAQEVTSLAVQVHGGMGFIEETGIAQFYRDARITTIYEGTTAIQANDFIGRKFLRDAGEGMKQWLDLMRQDCQQADQAAESLRDSVVNAINDLETSCQNIAAQGNDATRVAAVAVNFLMQAGTVAGAWQMLNSAQAAKTLMADDENFYQAKIITAEFYCQQVLPRAAAYASAVKTDHETVMAMSEQQF